MQTGNPLAQATLEVWHAVGGGVGVQGAPGRQALHVPPPQTWFAPQAVPFATGVKVSVQAGDGVQESVPTSHGFEGTQDAPGVHAPHRPVLHTSPVPQAVPSGTGTPVSRHAGAPAAQLVRHTVQDPTGAVQSTQATHAPALQTEPAPQLVPSASGVPVSVQIGPGPQVSVPVSHGFAGTQEPAAQRTQAPALQMPSVPQGVPSGRLPLSTQAAEPLAQVMVAVRQVATVTHDAPSVQGPQTPLAQTWFTPQVVPFASIRPVSTQAGPVVQE